LATAAGGPLQPGTASQPGRCVVGLCGGVGCGKSTAARWLQQWGALHCDVDAIGHQVLGRGEPGAQAVAARFGPSILDKTGTVDRKVLGALVFSDPAALAVLNALLHPLMCARIDGQIEAWQSAPAAPALFVVDAALLFDMGLDSRCDETLAISARQDVQVARIAAARGLSEQQARDRVAAQPAAAQWRRRASAVIDNDGSLGEFAQAVARWWSDLSTRRALGLAVPERDE